jgi:hypothetical protein
LLQEDNLPKQSSQSSSIIGYFHKDSQIAFSYGNKFDAQIRIPGDSAIDYLISKAPSSSLNSLQKLPAFLP